MAGEFHAAHDACLKTPLCLPAAMKDVEKSAALERCLSIRF